jgi:Skp family chaperone for outer membrane proteins
LRLNNLFFLFLIFFSFSSYSTTVRVIDIDLIINQNQSYQSFLEQIKKDQSQHKKVFEESEASLQEVLNNLNELKLILDTEELEKEIFNYNEKFNIFNESVLNFNNHYEVQIITFENKLLEKILDILKDYSIINKIDLILTKNSYIISNNSINITKEILDELNKFQFDISFEKYK